MLALHGPQAVFSLRHMPSWLLLAFSAGSVNAAAFLACARFVTHVTGSATRIGLDVGQWWLMVDYALVLGAFVLGAMLSVLAIDGRHHRGRTPLYALPLAAVAVLLVTVAVTGHLGLLGVFGGQPEEPVDFVLLCALSLAMGLQNAAVATSTGLVVRTTHLTGPATDLGINLATSLFAQGEARRAAIRGTMLRAGKITAFIAGAIVMAAVAPRVGFLAFLLPAGNVLLAMGLSFTSLWNGNRLMVAVPVQLNR
ncbi:MAG: YoaK family protein [Myxococcota bacterium]